MKILGGTPTASWVVLVQILCLSLTWRNVAGLQENPLMGQGIPPEKPVDVYVSALLEKLIAVSDADYRFDAKFVLYLSWQDDRAYPGAKDLTYNKFRKGAHSNCDKPCFSDVPVRSDNTKMYNEYLCCDDVWLPTITMANVYSLPDDRLEPYQIYLDKSGSVGWRLNLQATFFTPMYFGNYPFDSQSLTMQFVYSHGAEATTVNQFVPSATATRWFQRGGGDVAAGWSVEKIHISTFNTSLVDFVHHFTSLYGSSSHESDPLPMASEEKEYNTITSRVMMEFDIEIKVRRHWMSHVLTIIIPILLLITMTFVSYFIHPSHLGERITMHITVFLSMTALQFVVSAKLPASSYATGVEEMVLIGYIVATISVPEAIIVHMLEKFCASKVGARPRQEDVSLSDSEDDDSIFAKKSSTRGKKRKDRSNSDITLFSFLVLTLKPQYGSRVIKIIDRFVFYSLLLVMVMCVSLALSQGTMEGGQQ